MVAEVVCAVALAGVGYLIFRRAGRVAEYGDTTSVLKLPLAPVVYLMGAMITIAAADPPAADLRAAQRRRRQEHLYEAPTLASFAAPRGGAAGLGSGPAPGHP